MDWDFELVAGPYAAAADGPCWDGKELVFSLVGESKLLGYDPSTGAVRDLRKHTSNTRGLALASGGFMYGCQSGSRRIVRFNPDGSATAMPAKLDGAFHNYPDDVAVDRQGRVWFSDSFEGAVAGGRPFPLLGHASVLRLEPGGDGGSIQRMTLDTRAPRGILLSADGRTLYVAEDGPAPADRRELRAYGVTDDGMLGSYTVLHTFGADHRGVHRGIDGMCSDAEDNIIACAGWEKSGPGPMIYVFSPSGVVLETHVVPAERPVNCAFGDDDLGTLYVTTSQGQLFRIRNSERRGRALTG